MPTLSAQLVHLDEAWELLAQANRTLSLAGMGAFDYSEHSGQRRHFSYEIGDIKSKIIDALNSINNARIGIASHVQKNDQRKVVREG